MTRDELFDALVVARPAPGDAVYVARRGDEYEWRTLAAGEAVMGPLPGEEMPDAWIFHTGGWPQGGDRDRDRAYFDDLVAEMDSMTGGPDRCRWPMDDPYHHRH